MTLPLAWCNFVVHIIMPHSLRHCKTVGNTSSPRLRKETSSCHPQQHRSGMLQPAVGTSLGSDECRACLVRIRLLPDLFFLRASNVRGLSCAPAVFGVAAEASGLVRAAHRDRRPSALLPFPAFGQFARHESFKKEKGPYGERPCGVHTAIAVGAASRKR